MNDDSNIFNDTAAAKIEATIHDQNNLDGDDEGDDGDEEEDDDDDDWSRQVQTDEGGSHVLMLQDETLLLPATRQEVAHTSEHIQQPVPQPRELSLKEQMVMRERELRIETKRARLKRQFALSNDNDEGGGDNSDLNATGLTEESEGDVQDALRDVDEILGLSRTAGVATSVSESAAETLGEESIIAHPDEEHSESRLLGFNMERFLRNSDSFDPQLETMDEGREESVVMERFLKESVNPQTTGVASSEVARSVSFDVDQPSILAAMEDQIPGPLESFGEDPETNASVDAETSLLVEPDIDDVVHDPLSIVASLDNHDIGSDRASSSTAQALDEPRVLRLTEADMKEMAAIEEASIGNAPPSEREETLSEIGELADFGGHILTGGNFRVDTPTTAIDSVSNVSAPAASDHDRLDHPSIDGIVHGSGSTHSVEINPLLLRSKPDPATLFHDQGTNVSSNGSNPIPISDNGLRSLLADKEEGDKLREHPVLHNVASSPVHGQPSSNIRSPSKGEMKKSPLGSISHIQPRMAASYGSIQGHLGPSPMAHAAPNQAEIILESAPLLTDVPPEIITRRSHSEGMTSFRDSFRLRLSHRSVESFLDSIFSDVRSEEESVKLAIQNESEIYNNSNIIGRVTLVLELPVLLMISGGSDALCQLIGRSRYQLLIGFLPLSSAISGNVGLQASSLTTRAISHEQVTPSSYVTWLTHEIGAALCLAIGMGCVLGTMAFVASGLDYAFAVTIMIAQFLSVLTAGITGTFAPLLFSFVCNRDSGKWAGPIETAIQDIVGSFAMVVISYKILLFIGPGPIDPGDVCVSDS